MNNFSKFVSGIVAGIVVVTMGQLSAQDNNRLQLVQKGELTLTCHLQKGITIIDSNVVTDYHPETGWKFINGSAKSCWTN